MYLWYFNLFVFSFVLVSCYCSSHCCCSCTYSGSGWLCAILLVLIKPLLLWGYMGWWLFGWWQLPYHLAFACSGLVAVALGRVVLSALGLQCVYTIAASFIALLYLYCLLPKYFKYGFALSTFTFRYIYLHKYGRDLSCW